MSGTVMKFGPQWIRTLTDGAAPSSTNTTTTTANTTTNTSTNTNNNNSSTSASANYAAATQQPATAATMNTSSSFSSQNSNGGGGGGGASGKYKLAEYRYGREEMLALFEQEMDAPEDIRKFTDLYVEKVRIPMAMTQVSEEELKLSSKNWNSDIVLRSSVKSAANAAAAAGQTGFGAVSNSLAGAAAGALGSAPATTDRDTRQMSDRGATGALTAAGVLSSSPRGPPGSLSRIPLEQRGILSSLNSRGPPSSIRNLVGRGTNMYMRSQSHDDESADEIGVGGGFDTRFGLPGQARQPNSLRARFETNRTVSGAPGSKPIDIKAGVGGGGSATLDGGGELSTSSDRIGRSVFDRLPNKYSVDDKIIRKDTNGRPLQSAGDWRSREWSSSGPENRASKLSAGDERSWRSSRGGAAEDWRSNSNSTSSSTWYVRTDDQRGLRAAGGTPQNQENLNSGFSGKRDTLRRPSADGERHDDDDDDVGVGLQHQPRHRRDSLPEWSIGDPLSGDKVGSFDASGAFREIARDDGSSDPIVMGGQKDKQGQQQQAASSFDTTKSSSAAGSGGVGSSGGAEQEWRLKTNESSNTYDTRNLNGIDTSSSLTEMERLSLSNRNVTAIQQQSNNRNNSEISGSNESRSKQAAVAAAEARARDQDRFSDVNFQNSIHNKMDLQSRTSPQTTVDNEHKKSSFDNLRNSVSPQSCQRAVNRTNLPANLQQMLKKQPNNISNQQNQQQQQQMFLSALSGGSGSHTMQQAAASGVAEEDGFAHLERAAEIMVAEWTAEEEHEPSSAASFYVNKIREQQDAQVANNAEARLSNQAQQQQQQQQPQPQQGGSEQIQANAVFDSNNQKKFILLPFNHEDSQQWFYRDTQGVIQGPFSGSEMFEWYKAGYFVKELLVRRACDELFYPLGDVIKMWDRIPFASIPMNVPPPPPITGQTLLQFRAVTKQLELAVSQGQIPPNAFGLTHPATVLLHGPLLQQQQQQQVHQVLAAASLNQNISGPQERQAGIRQILDATRQHDQTAAMVQQQQQRAAISGAVTDQNEMQTQLRQLLAQLKNREGFSNLNAQEQQEVLVRQFVASRNMPSGAGAAGLQQQQQQQQQQPDQTTLLQGAQMMPFLPFFSNEQERFRYQQQQQQQQQRLEMERHQKEEVEKAQGRFIMEQRMKAEEEKQRIMDEMQKRQRKQKEDSEKQRQEAEKERLLKLSQLKQQQLAKQQEEFRQQMQNQQRIQAQQQQEKKQQQQQLQQIERAKKAAQAQQVQQEQQRKTAWSTVSKPDQEPVSLAILQKMQEEEKEKERERQRQIQQQIQSSQQQQQQLQLQRQMTWANAAQQNKPAPVKTLAEIQKEEEERLAREKQTRKTKVVAAAPTGVWNNAASHLSWKNPPADS